MTTERDALTRVQDRVASGLLRVNMSDDFGCIGYHVARLMAKDPKRYLEEVYQNRGDMFPLYYPYDVPRIAWEKITSAQIVAAIDRVLRGETGPVFS